MSGLILSVDTATPAGGVALLEGGSLLGEVLLNTRTTHSDRLLVAARQILADTGKELSDLDGLAVVRGPGSFTGLRVGMGTVQGLALALDKPVVPVSSLAALAMNAAGSTETVWSVLDARKGEVYAAAFSLEDGLPVALDKEQVCSPERLVSQIKDPVVLVGSGAEVYRALFTDGLEGRARFLPPFLNLPRPSSTGVLGGKILQDGGSVDASGLRPVYIRPSEAEIALKKKGE